MATKNLTNDEFQSLQIGSLIRVSIPEDGPGNKFISFPDKAEIGMITIANKSILTYLGFESKKYTGDMGFPKIEMRFYFLTNETIIYSIEPGYQDKFRNFNWELVTKEKQ